MAIDSEIFSPSILYSLDDYILHISLLMMVCQFYLEPDDKPQKDFMISPICTPDNILKQFPRTYLLLCEKDPLHDDTLRYFLRMMYNK